MVVKTLVHFDIPADNVDKLKEFYSTCFGWKFEKAPIPEFDYWLISTGPKGKSVGGGMYQKIDPSDSQRNYINVDDLDSAIQVFKNAGGREIVGKQEVPDQGWSFIGADPEGNKIALWQQMRKARTRSRGRGGRRKRGRGAVGRTLSSTKKKKTHRSRSRR